MDESECTLLTECFFAHYDKDRVKITRYIAASFFSFFVFLVYVSPVHAQSQCPSAFSALCNIDFSKGAGVGTIVQIIIVLAAVAAMFFLVWGGVRWIMSGGERGKIEQARGTIIAAIVGLVIALIAYFIVSVIVQVFTGQGINSLGLPKLVPGR